MKATNLVVEAEFLHFSIDSEDEFAESIADSRDYIRKYMNNQGYRQSDYNPLSEQRFLSMTFTLARSEINLTAVEKLKQRLGLTNAADKSILKQKKTLNATRNDIPFEVSITLSSYEEGEESSVLVKVRSEPVIYQKYKQNFISELNTDRDYSYIIEENKKFVEQLIKGIGGRITREPHSPMEQISNNVHDSLDNFGFNQTLNVLEEGRTSLEESRVDDGLRSLRLSLEKFFEELIEKCEAVEEEPKRAIDENIEILEENELISSEMARFIHKSMYGWLYRTISEEVVHDITEINYTDGLFMYNSAEMTMDHCIEKVLLGR